MEEKNIYAKIRDIRQARGLTVNTLADKMGEDHQKVGRIERGKRSLTIDYLMKVSKALDTPLEDFFSEEKTQEPILDLLNEIVILVEEKCHLPLDAKSKGKLISKIYELTLKFPKVQQQMFLESFFEGLQVFESTK